jgi:hypothetical protein
MRRRVSNFKDHCITVLAPVMRSDLFDVRLTAMQHWHDGCRKLELR